MVICGLDATENKAQNEDLEKMPAEDKIGRYFREGRERVDSVDMTEFGGSGVRARHR